MTTLYQELVDAGVPVDSHYSDLYVKDTPEAREILKRYPELRGQRFRNNIDGEFWLDFFGQFTPYWEKKQKVR